MYLIWQVSVLGRRPLFVQTPIYIFFNNSEFDFIALISNKDPTPIYLFFRFYLYAK